MVAQILALPEYRAIRHPDRYPFLSRRKRTFTGLDPWKHLFEIRSVRHSSFDVQYYTIYQILWRLKQIPHVPTSHKLVEPGMEYRPSRGVLSVTYISNHDDKSRSKDMEKGQL